MRRRSKIAICLAVLAAGFTLGAVTLGGPLGWASGYAAAFAFCGAFGANRINRWSPEPMDSFEAEMAALVDER